MKVRTLAVLFASLSIAPVTQAYESSVCINLMNQKQANDARRLRILTDYPGTATTLFSCAVYASKQIESEQIGAFLTCTGATCLFIVGVDNCLGLAGSVIEIISRDETIRKQSVANGCNIGR
jgi:hypothetical protein